MSSTVFIHKLNLLPRMFQSSPRSTCILPAYILIPSILPEYFASTSTLTAFVPSISPVHPVYFRHYHGETTSEIPGPKSTFRYLLRHAQLISPIPRRLPSEIGWRTPSRPPTRPPPQTSPTQSCRWNRSSFPRRHWV